MFPRRTCRRAFTLIEVLMASAVLAFSVAAIAYAVTSGQLQTYHAMHEMRATALADALMEEIVALPYADPDGASVVGPEAGETSRDTFDNIDDYHGFTEAAGQVTDQAGQAFPETYAMFSRSVTASYGNTAIASLGGNINGIAITVTVTDGRGGTWAVTRFIVEPAP